MTIPKREALAQRLGQAELGLQKAMRGLDGSPTARTRLAKARIEYRAAEQEALRVLGAHQALEVIEQLAYAP
ncbi:hypothetical protein OV208_15240 [Corallococcus sp. bb12-1]|uniref:hypothetical protein n=1 Tax=Corallococcus sp. bb12-1 TaxID=2996784 RepID=UPI00226F0A92|nr:hypothetical protein [Corallococcus sp. bb12-1]MCY1042678.1 hypothetical protein [Corallococcus sp. bb12-1]